MGCNYYLYRKMNYTEGLPAELGCGEGNDEVQKLTNGYVYKDTYYSTIEELSKVFELKIHIGKSSCGWYFSLAIYPQYAIVDLDEWNYIFNQDNSIIKDEYGRVISPKEMMSIITERKQLNYDDFENEEEYEIACVRNHNEAINKYNIGRAINSYEELLNESHAKRGKYGLWQHQEDKYTKNTNGTYDYIISGNNTDEGEIFC